MFVLSSIDPLVFAYAAILTMAVIPIIIGSYRSVPSSKTKKEKEIMSSKDAYLSPIIGSIALFSLYLLVKFVSKELINIIITGYVTFFGSICLIQLITPEIRSVVHFLTCYDKAKENESKPSETSVLADTTKSDKFLNSSIIEEFKNLSEEEASSTCEQTKPACDETKKSTSCSIFKFFNCILDSISIKVERKNSELLSFSFDLIDILTVILVAIFATYYVIYKGWISSNIIGEAICFGAISMIHLDSFITGSILLFGLFLYDIFWVFGTDVMVTVAKSFDAPLLLRFPRNIFESTSQWTMLGLGDIVIPGIFISLCLRYDHERAGKPESFSFKKVYFTTCLIAYFLGLITTIVVMHTFRAAQPALLYLSPACIFSVIITSLFQKDFKNVLKYSSVQDEEKTPETEEPKMESEDVKSN